MYRLLGSLTDRPSQQETLRVHPVAYTVYRETSNDDVIPLSKPIRTLNGDMITEIPVPAGQKILSSISGYNRLAKPILTLSMSKIPKLTHICCVR